MSKNLVYYFNVADFLEVENASNGDWVQVTCFTFRSYAGNRRTNGEEYVGNLSGTGVSKIEKAYFGNPVFSEAGGKKYFSDAYTAETGDGTSKPKAVNVERYDDEEDDD